MIIFEQEIISCQKKLTNKYNYLIIEWVKLKNYNT